MNEKKFNLSLLKYLSEQPSKSIGEINRTRDLENAQKIQKFFVHTTLSEIARRSFDNKRYSFGVRIERDQFNFDAYTSTQYDMALSYRTQMRVSRDGKTAYLLCADYIPTSRQREVDLFVTSWFRVDMLLFWMLTGCCGIYCFIAVLMAVDRSPAFWAFVTDAATLIICLFLIGHAIKWFVAKRYLTTFEPLYMLHEDDQRPATITPATTPTSTNMDDIDI